MAHHYESEIKCPYCDYVFSDSWELNDSDGEEVECGSCEREFILGVYVDVSYSSDKIDCADLNTPTEHDYGTPVCVDFGQDTCDRWNSEAFMNKSNHTPHSSWTRECENCDDKEYKQTELGADCPFN